MNPILKGLDEKHLPFVGWTFKRYNNKEQKPSASSLFDLKALPPNPSRPSGPTNDEKMRVSSSFDRLSISEDKTTVARKLSTSKKEITKKKKEEKKTPKKKDKKRDSKR
eukprot:TRINITY_DN2715_c0_g2_i1.p3 TRINITY_DN2715_c0_g2~~TRINITY_DN2715_c0_g2_i1.p3  ORF type:complete len:109 (+),score=35.36 TRINITY_DN2715_c0_g2_i1:579-905(+)